MFFNQFPTVTTDPNKLEEQAREVMSVRSFNYVGGGAGERATMAANRLAFRQWKIVPRMLRPTTHRDMSVELFGTKQPNPLLIAPIGVQSIFHDDKETGVASIAKDIEISYVLSTASSSTIEEVAEVSGNGQRWFQLYWPHTDSITISLLVRAKKAGFEVLVVTLDTWALAWRPWDLDRGYVPFLKGLGCAVGFSDPAFQAQFRQQSGGKSVDDNIVEASAAWTADVFSGAAHTWDQLEVIKDNWDGPIVLKGIQSLEDAKLAVDAGMDGIIVSNHGGRQLDGAVGSLDQLAEIAEAVGDKLTILFDSGIRTGVDVIKALSLGAKAVLIGRPWVYGAGKAGKKGAKDVLKGILADLDQVRLQLN
ncbi:hypothetical protein B0A55_04667 [Friedmanniomyces simplex]|uniref:FMN hydroxy acid dehydrogenase domain-containing protein n=1 Tax=Friedmanniomyces simplex TaxID=329884 RepID=A0A4U0Y3F5_9PEZI|nr:hypothetical protein B0A55_04667 [Friedmanniomyces simplex]